MMLSLQLKIIILALVCASLFGGYVWVRHDAVEDYKAEQAVEQAKADAIKQAAYDDLAAELIVAKAARTVEFKTITRTVEKLVDRTVYQQQCIDAEGLAEANKALRGGVKNELY